ncbi:unnamed protein product [Clavelina lepadiformis]|uniref:Uncharacterized protein n=1 Tax=Clavelina lepadiformis TaxID=159417 RepID=A0ABP0H0D7_CLALP
MVKAQRLPQAQHVGHDVPSNKRAVTAVSRQAVEYRTRSCRRRRPRIFPSLFFKSAIVGPHRPDKSSLPYIVGERPTNPEQHCGQARSSALTDGGDSCLVSVCDLERASLRVPFVKIGKERAKCTQVGFCIGPVQ